MANRVPELIVAIGVLSAALTTVGCSSEQAPSRPAASSTPGVSDQGSPPPTVSELNAMLERGLDPAIPASEKTDLVQGSDADPELINRAAQAAREAGVVITVTEIQPFGADAATATATLTVNGQDNVGAIPLVYEGGKWKLQKQWACDIVTGMAQMHSPACE